MKPDANAAARRNAAVQELFARHVRPGSTLADVAALLGGARWIDDARIEKIGVMAGEIPVPIPPDGAAFVVRLPDDATNTLSERGIYLSVDRDISANDLRDALGGTWRDPSLRDVRIAGVAPFPAPPPNPG